MPIGDTGGVAFAPRLPSLVVPRHGLVQRVEHAREHPLTIVRGPQGSGKTTLLALWAGAGATRGVWIGLGPSASERLAFWRQVIDGMLDAHLIPAGSVLHDLDMSVEIEPRLRTVLQRGLASVSEPITLVLDDLHEAPESVHDDLHWLLLAGVALRCVVTTRTTTVLEQPDYLAQVDTALILPAALALDEHEVTELAALFDEPDAAAEITEAFGGWALPTRAALLQLRDGTAATVGDAIERVHGVGDGFVIDLLDDSGYSRFLLRTSVARRLTIRLATELGGADAASHLARAENDGLGTWSEAASGTEFVLHPHLRTRLEQEFTTRLPGEVEAARRALARDLGERGDLFEMARQYAALGDGDALTRMMRRHYADLILPQGVFAAILATLDEGELRRHPELLAMQFLDSYASGKVGRPGLSHMVSLTSAVVYARLGGGKPVDRVSLLLVLLASQRVNGHFDQALGTAERLVTAFSLLDDESRDELWGVIPRAWVQIATTFFYNEQPAPAEEYLSIALDLPDTQVSPRARLHAESMRELIMAMRGDITALEPQLELSLHRRRPVEWQGTFSAAGFHLAQAYRSLEHFDGAAARGHLEELAPHEATIEHWPLIARVRSLAALVEGEPYLGLQTLAANIEAHADRPPVSASMTMLLASSRAELLLADHQPHRAAETLKPHRRGAAAQLVRSRVELALGNHGRALSLAAPLAWSEQNLPRAKAEALLVVAVASHHLNQAVDARAAVERAVTLMSTYGLRRPWLAVPRRDIVAVLDAAGLPHAQLLEGVPNVHPGSTRDWSLTATELRVLTLLETTGRIDELAAELQVSANTVKTHLRQIYRKLGVKSRSEALGVAGLHGLLGSAAP